MIKITKKQNVIVEGIKYKFISVNGYTNTTCGNCAFTLSNGRASDACESAPCTPSSRNDEKRGYFIKAKK